VGTPIFSKFSIVSGQPLTSNFPFDSFLNNAEISTWAMPKPVHLLHASTNQLEQWITAVEKKNDELTQEAQ
jgi:hypothetical protein